MAVLINVDDGKVRVRAAVDGDLVDGAQRRRNLLWTGDARLGLAGQRVGDLVVDVVARAVKDVGLDAVPQQNPRCPVDSLALAPDSLPSLASRRIRAHAIAIVVVVPPRHGSVTPGADVAAAHVHLPPRLLVLCKVPFAQKAQRAHAEGQDGRHRPVQLEQARGAQHRPVAAKRGNRIDLVGDARAVVDDKDGKVELLLDRHRDARLDDDVDLGVVAADVPRKRNHRLGHLGRVQLLHQQQVSRRPRPVERQQRRARLGHLQVSRVRALRQLGDAA